MSSTRSPVNSGPQSLLVNLEEGLRAVVAPERYQEVIKEALAIAKVEVIPDVAVSIRSFVEGALFTALSRHMGAADAREIVRLLERELARASGLSSLGTAKIRGRNCIAAGPPSTEVAAPSVASGTRTPTLPPASAAAIPATPALVVTRAAFVVSFLDDMIGDQVDVVPVSSTEELRGHLVHHRGNDVMVVVDRWHPCVDVDTGVCDLLRAELSARSMIVWWGATAHERTSVTDALAGGPFVVVCDFDQRLVDLGMSCRGLLQGATPPGVRAHTRVGRTLAEVRPAWQLLTVARRRLGA